MDWTPSDLNLLAEVLRAPPEQKEPVYEKKLSLEIDERQTPNFETTYFHEVGTETLFLPCALGTNSIDEATGIRITVDLPKQHLSDLRVDASNYMVLIESPD